MSVSTTVWFPVLTLLLGYLAKSITDWLQDRRRDKREVIARTEARRDQILLRRADFQRQTLLQLQDAISELTRKTAKANFTYTILQDEQGGEWGKHLLPEDDLESLRATRALASLLKVRVRDKLIVDLTDQVLTLSASSTTASSHKESFELFSQMSAVHDKIYSRLGQVLKDLDDLEDRELAIE